MSDYSKIIAVDFDGTLCDSAWPDAGPANQPVIDYVLEQKRNGAKIILWTNRTGGPLETAVKWCEERGLWFDAINDNLPEMIEFFGNNCRKVFANEYIDDRAIPMPGKPATNADRIHAMTDEELAEFLAEYRCVHKAPHCMEPNCAQCWLDWLKQEVDT